MVRKRSLWAIWARPKLSDPANEKLRLQPERDGRVKRCSGLHPAAKVRANRVRALLGQQPLLTAAEEQAWNPPADPDSELTAGPRVVVCSAPFCPRCQQGMRLVGSWRAAQPMLYPKRPP
jgi:hypothetical protein